MAATLVIGLSMTGLFPIGATALTVEPPAPVTQSPASYSPDSSDCMGNAGSQLAMSEDGSRVILADVSAYAGCYGNQVDEQKVWLSTDSGDNWTDSGLPLDHWGPVGSSADGRVLVAGSSGQANTNGGRLFVSTNFGQDWNESIGIEPEQGSVDHRHLWWDIDVSDDGSVILATSDGASAVHASFDSGETWQVVEHASEEDVSDSPELSWRGVAVSGDGSTAVLCRNSDDGAKFYEVSLDGNSGIDMEAATAISYSTTFDGGIHLCGSIDLDRTGETLITGSYWTQWIGIFRKSAGVWEQYVSHDFANDGVNNVQVSSDGMTLLVSFYQRLNTAISQDGGETWVFLSTSGNPGSIAAISGDGRLLLAHDYDDGFYSAQLSNLKRGVPLGQELMALDYYTDEFAFGITSSQISGNSGTLSNVPDYRPEGGGWSPVTSEDIALYHGCELFSVDTASGSLSPKTELNDALADASAEDCWSLATTPEGLAFIGSAAGIRSLDLQSQSITSDPFGPTDTTALAYHSQSGELWAFRDGGYVAGVVDPTTGEYEHRITMSDLVVQRVDGKNLSDSGVWSADFDGNGLLWMSAWNDDNRAILISFDPYSQNAASTVEIYGPIQGSSSRLNSDAIWFRGNVYQAPEVDPEQEPSQPQQAPALPLPEVLIVEQHSASTLTLVGRRLATVFAVRISGTPARVITQSDEVMIVAVGSVQSANVDVSLIGDFGQLTLIGQPVVNRMPLISPSSPTTPQAAERKGIFKAKSNSMNTTIVAPKSKLALLAGDGLGFAVCTGHTIAELSNRAEVAAAKARALKICQSLKDLNPLLEIEVRVDRRKHFGRSVHVMVLPD